MSRQRILIYAGTTEGRVLAEYLVRQGVRVHVCVATEYGESLLPCEGHMTVSHHPMDCDEMCALIRDYGPCCVVDATHPYAKEATHNIKTACTQCGVSYLRLVRRQGETGQDCIFVENAEDAVRFLVKTKGNILVTTGSKELGVYTKLPHYEERVYARVLSVREAVAKCEELGFRGRHLICMQGPFSVEMNLAMLRDYQIAYLVTKESGIAGGYPQKCEAAQIAGAKLIVIGRPRREEGYTLKEMRRILKKKMQLQGRRKVTVVGIGMGADEGFTTEAKKACGNAELLIGAKRMLKAAAENGQDTYAAYKAEDIVGYVKEHPEYEKIAIVLSGDPGFYSGARKLLELLEKETQLETEVIPGVSSIAYFCARLGISWEDAALFSVHGRKEAVLSTIRNHEKTLVLAGSAEDIRDILKKMTEFGYGELSVAVGSDLSYDSEQILKGKARDCLQYDGGNLAVLYVENPKGGQYPVTHGMADHRFIRGEVPMTKEEVRSVSLSKLRIHRDSIIYDIGAGTGSVAVEAALQARRGHVYAIEMKAEAVKLIQANRKRMQIDNLTIQEGMAPEALSELPAPDCVFIGGSKGRMGEILKAVARKNPKVRVVINAIALETLAEATESIRQFQTTDEEVVQLSVSKAKAMGAYHMMMGQNPVFIISFTYNEEV